MITDYRIVHDAGTYGVYLVEFDQDLNPVDKHNLNISSGSIADLTSLLVYCISSLTKPVIDIDEFDRDKQHDAAINTALELMRNKHDS
jgi:hypothetical protein